MGCRKKELINITMTYFLQVILIFLSSLFLHSNLPNIVSMFLQSVAIFRVGMSWCYSMSRKCMNIPTWHLEYLYIWNIEWLSEHRNKILLKQRNNLQEHRYSYFEYWAVRTKCVGTLTHAGDVMHKRVKNKDFFTVIQILILRMSTSKIEFKY